MLGVNMVAPRLMSLKASLRILASYGLIVSMKDSTSTESGMLTVGPSRHCARHGKAIRTGRMPDTRDARDITVPIGAIYGMC